MNKLMYPKTIYLTCVVIVSCLYLFVSCMSIDEYMQAYHNATAYYIRSIIVIIITKGILYPYYKVYILSHTVR